MNIQKLYSIKLFKGKEVVYDENLPFYSIDNIEDDVRGFMKLIRPFLEFDRIEHTYYCDLNPNGTCKK
jgi:hypothetical protein